MGTVLRRSVLVIASGVAILLTAQFRSGNHRVLLQPDVFAKTVNDNASSLKASETIHSTDSCPSRSEREFFDPFQDITFGPLQSQDLPYSSVHCVGTGRRRPELQSDKDSYNGRRPNFVSRSCQYRNLFYRPSDQTFHYFASPTEQRATIAAREAGQESQQEYLSRTEVSIGHVNDIMGPETLEWLRVTPWKPQVHKETPPVADTLQAGPENLKFLLFMPFWSENLGHFLWDDIMSLFTLLQLFGYARDTFDASSYQPVPFYVEFPNPKTKQNYGGFDPAWRCNPGAKKKWGEKCTPVYRKFYHEFFGVKADPCSGDILRTGNWLRGDNKIGGWKQSSKKSCQLAPHRTNRAPKETYILLPEVLAGTGRLSFFGCEDDCSIGRGPQWRDFRDFLYSKLLGPQLGCHTSQEAPKGYVTFSVPGGSSRPGEVWWFTEEILLAKQQYGEDAVQVVDMASMSIQEQALMAKNSAVLLTNHGGGGSVSIFLQTGTSVFVFWHAERRFEHNFYESAGYFRTTWVSVHERQYVNRTMALIASEVEKTARVWPEIVAAEGLRVRNE